ncbi:hypothetical protein ACEPAI_3943 [Sanghuangporus weigelae]
MEEIYAGLSQTGNTLDDAACNESSLFGARRYRQSSTQLGSQEYLDGLRKTQDAVARTSFRRPEIRETSSENKVKSGTGAKFEHLGGTSYRIGVSYKRNSQTGASTSSEASTGGEESRRKVPERAKASKTSEKSGGTQRGKVAKTKSEATIQSRNGAISLDSGDSSDELNLTSSSQPIRSPKRPHIPFSDAGTAPPESDSDDYGIQQSLSSLLDSKITPSSSSVRKSRPCSSKWRPRNDENSFSDETPEKKKPKIKPHAAYGNNYRPLLNGVSTSSLRNEKRSKPLLGPSRSTNSYQSGVEVMDEEETPRSSKNTLKKRPAPFPMAKLATEGGAKSVTRKIQRSRLAPFPMLMESAYDDSVNVHDGNEESGSDEDPLLMNRNDEIVNRGGLAPFPMLLEDRPQPSDSDFAKVSNSSADGSDYHTLGQNKRESNGVRYVADTVDRLFTQTDVQPDPKTLCPYCDMPFPPNPTPLLIDMLKRIPKYPDARPTNPLGLKAPLLSYVTMCQRHQFEMQLLPKARAAGWPTCIDFTTLPGRIHALRKHMTVLLRDKGKSIFWRELKKDIDKYGARKTMGVTNQFDSFEKSQPGYYGEQGAVIITQTLSHLFPPDSIDPDRVAPLTPTEFTRCVLVPECAVALIQEDLGSGTSTEYAIRTLRKSSKYGTAMFPDLDNRDAMSVGEDLGMGQQVGEAIMKERVRARRAEISEEEKETKDTGIANAETTGRKDITNKAKAKTKATAHPARNNDTGRIIELSNSASVQTDASTNNRRPKAKGGKTSDASDIVISTKTSGKPTKQFHQMAAPSTVNPRPNSTNRTKASTVFSDTESFESELDEKTPKPPARTYNPYESDSGIVLPEEDNRYVQRMQKNTESSKARSKLSGSFQPLQAAKARNTGNKAVFKWTMWENDDESDIDNSDNSPSHSESDISCRRRTTVSAKTESHSWLLSENSSPNSTPQR